MHHVELLFKLSYAESNLSYVKSLCIIDTINQILVQGRRSARIDLYTTVTLLLRLGDEYLGMRCRIYFCSELDLVATGVVG